MRQGEYPKAILFLCTMNAVRSPMAAALLRHLAGPGLRIDSAGVTAGTLDPLAVEALREIGVALGGHRPRILADLDTGSYDLIIALSAEARAPAEAVGGPVEFWPFDDPTLVEGSREQRLCAYRAVRDELIRKLKSRFQLAPA